MEFGGLYTSITITAILVIGFGHFLQLFGFQLPRAVACVGYGGLGMDCPGPSNDPLDEIRTRPGPRWSNFPGLPLWQTKVVFL